MDAAPRKSDLGARTLVGVAAGLVALIALWLGGFAWWGFVGLVALAALWEWAALVGCGAGRSAMAVAALAATLAIAAPGVWGPMRDSVAVLTFAGIIVAMVIGNTQAGWGLLYAGLPAMALLSLRAEPNGFALALWTLLIVILTDTGAYFTGRAIGGPKLSPRLSPNKTWAGLGGGMVAAGIGGAIVAVAFGLPAPLLWLGAPLAVAAQAGDLYESALKRQAGVKDSGRLLPGHGGVLDRIDGLVPVATIVGALVAGGAI